MQTKAGGLHEGSDIMSKHEAHTGQLRNSWAAMATIKLYTLREENADRPQLCPRSVKRDIMHKRLPTNSWSSRPERTRLSKLVLPTERREQGCPDSGSLVNVTTSCGLICCRTGYNGGTTWYYRRVVAFGRRQICRTGLIQLSLMQLAARSVVRWIRSTVGTDDIRCQLSE